MKQIQFPYGKTKLTYSFEEDALAGVLLSKIGEYVPAADHCEKAFAKRKHKDRSHPGWCIRHCSQIIKRLDLSVKPLFLHTAFSKSSPASPFAKTGCNSYA